jgi:transposase-like protein
MRLTGQRSRPAKAYRSGARVVHLSGLLLIRRHDNAAAIMTDDNPAYEGCGDQNTLHQVVNHSVEEYVRGDVHMNSVESARSLLKRSIVGSYHRLSEKHLPAYLNEFEFRFNNRKNPNLFRDTLLKLIEARVLQYKALTKSA